MGFDSFSRLWWRSIKVCRIFWTNRRISGSAARDIRSSGSKNETGNVVFRWMVWYFVLTCKCHKLPNRMVTFVEKALVPLANSLRECFAVNYRLVFGCHQVETEFCSWWTSWFQFFDSPVNGSQIRPIRWLEPLGTAFLRFGLFCFVQNRAGDLKVS